MSNRTLLVWTPNNGDFLITAAVLQEILGGEGLNYTDTAITTAVGGTLTAAGFLGGQITRTGPTAAFSDATDTAAALVTGLGGFQLGQTFITKIKNATQYPMTVTAGAGVTWSAVAVIAPFSVGEYYGKVGGTSASPTVTFAHIETVAIRAAQWVVNPQLSALNTVGAGVVLAAAMATGIINRGGTQTAVFTDATDSAANIIAGLPSLTTIGASAEITYLNNTIFPATLHAGATVTLTDTVIPAKSWARFLVSYTSAGAITMTPIAQGFFPHSGTVTANGATPVPVTDANVNANSVIVLTFASAGGTAHGAFVSSTTPQTGFSINSLAGDTSVYNYTILG